MTKSTAIMGSADWWRQIINYEIIRGNLIWRFGLVVLIVPVTKAAGRVVEFAFPTQTLYVKKD